MPPKLSNEQIIAQFQKNAPISKEFIDNVRQQGKMLYNKTSKGSTLEYFEYQGAWAIVLQGKADNPFKGYAIIVDKENLHQNPLNHTWSASLSRSSMHIYTTMHGKTTLFSSFIINRTIKLYHLKTTLDFRLKNLTSSHFTKNACTGVVGVRRGKGDGTIYTHHPEKKAQIHNKATPVSSFLEGQQLYNALLLDMKENNPENLQCFGWFFDRGILQRLFPSEYYDANGYLLPEHLETLRPHAHLFAPIREEWTQMEIGKQKDACFGAEYDWLSQNDFIPDLKNRLKGQ